MLCLPKKCPNGFTLIELMIVTTLVLVVLTLSTVIISSVLPKQQLASAVELLFSDIQNQQQKAMLGDTMQPGDGSRSYGIHFEGSSYTLFAGSSYSANDPNNFVVKLPGNITATTPNNPTSTILFTPISGDFTSYTDKAHASVYVLDTLTGSSKVLWFNQFGVAHLD